MKRKRTMKRQWLAAMVVAAAFSFGAGQQAMAQTPVQQGIRTRSNTATVNGTAVTTGDIVSAGRGTTVTITTADRTGESTPKVAKVTVTKKENFLAAAATITGDETVSVNGTTTLTATVEPTFANTVVWTVENGTGSAEFVSGETTAATVTSVVNHETGQATAELKGLTIGDVTVNVKATGDATEMINEMAKTVTVQNPATVTSAPTAVTKVLRGSSLMSLCSAGTASNGTMMYAVSTSNETAPETGWSNTVPKANHSALTAEGTYYVWYYVAPNDGYVASEKQVTNAVAVNNERSETINATTTAGSVTINGTYFKVQGEIQTFNNNTEGGLLLSLSKSINISQIPGQDKLISKVVLYLMGGMFHGYSMIIPSNCTYSYDTTNFKTTITSNTGSIGSSISMRKNFPSDEEFYRELASKVMIYYY